MDTDTILLGLPFLVGLATGTLTRSRSAAALAFLAVALVYAAIVRGAIAGEPTSGAGGLLFLAAIVPYAGWMLVRTLVSYAVGHAIGGVIGPRLRKPAPRTREAADGE